LPRNPSKICCDQRNSYASINGWTSSSKLEVCICGIHKAWIDPLQIVIYRFRAIPLVGNIITGVLPYNIILDFNARGTGSVSCNSVFVLHLCRFLDQEELMEREAMVQNP